ncbi:Sister chromatid cohesion complex Cohesin, subunit RAD21/SCC1 [Handroanthus impetiginosus]|uniref:Sister chromatid cohesion complex Cohesin, subunit RAD21/SCC1 n=1 Tax=Handroanthus impetiginosus TaxID=429701 RepID=A0A2G9H9B1_9LAMI|nr:Sister chromatid cohesion complex Cohesin, subunit RAD21/SCC1 [Handroanthus impetiginosus]
MFYSQFILAKKGPLGTIWIAAHLERKLRKNQVADTDIGVSVDSILFPEVPIALRLSSHLLLGVVRIYNKKVNYLFDDCSEALLKIKQAFRSTAVDLPPEESKAPYHSITLPETFDLDDFELPDNDIFQSNYVDHHISSREQITLQDNMEGVSYSTSKFGLDERFGDGDASGLDLDEELLLEKIGTSGHADQSADPQSSFGSRSPVKQDECPEDRAANLETMVGGVDEYADLMDYAQAPRTPGLVEEPNLSNVQDASACDDHLESEYHLMEPTTREHMNNVPYEDKQEVDWCSRDDTISDALPQRPPEENEYLSCCMEIKESKPQGESPVEANVEAIKPALEFTDKMIQQSDVRCQEDLPTEVVNEGKTYLLSVDAIQDDHQGPNEIGLEKRAFETGLGSTSLQLSEVVSEKDLAPSGVEDPGSVRGTSDQQKSCDDGSELALENQVGPFPDTHVNQACQGTIDSREMNLDAHDKEASNETLVLRPCSSILEQPDVTKPAGSVSTDADVKSNGAALATDGMEETTIPFSNCTTGNSEQNVKENQVHEHALGATKADAQVHSTNSQKRLVENLNSSAESEMPAPEKLLSVPEGNTNLHRDMLAEISPGDIEEVNEGDVGSKSAAGRKRSFTESTLTEQSLNSVESSRQVRIKRTTGSVPDDDDLLSSILAGRKSSVLKVKPTPPPSEVTSMKRARSAARSGAPKRKVLTDDTMVLHGDTIRQQLTNTEDIRRVRKKAPCTLPEISMLQKQHMEDEIFLETIFTGMSVELASLHNQVYDLSRIRVCQNDVKDAPLEIAAELRLPSRDDENGVPSGTIVEPNFASHNDEHGASRETVGELPLTSPNNENHDMEDDKVPGKVNVIEESVHTVNNDEIAQPSKNHLSDDRLKEAKDPSIEVNVSQEPIKSTNDMGPDDSQQELSGNVGDANPTVIGGVEPLDSTGLATNYMDNASASLVQTNEDVEPNSNVNIDASDVVPDQKMAAPSVELGAADVDVEQISAKDKVTEKDADVSEEGEMELGARDDILPDVARDAATVELVPNANHGWLEYNVHSDICNMTSEKQQEVEFSYRAPVGVLEDGYMNNGQNLDHPEAYQPDMMDAGISGFELHDRDELDYSAAANDTDFLNVDDDELTEAADDYMPDAEETRYTENSGWSTRTRGVSKYLQSAFFKEAVYGRNSLSMDNLLIGKSRKEASRMFFETLVLKTRDYIHVEQKSPFDEITIKPRTRLMKSNF